MNKLIDSIKGKPVTVGIYARPGDGKTALLLQAAQMLTSETETACLLSLELSETGVRERLQRMNADPERFAILDAPHPTFADVEDFLAKQERVSVIAVDYLQLLREDMRGRWKELAVKHNVPVLVTSQLPRAVEDRPQKRPTVEDMASGAFRPDAAVFVRCGDPAVIETLLPERRSFPTQFDHKTLTFTI